MGQAKKIWRFCEGKRPQIPPIRIGKGSDQTGRTLGFTVSRDGTLKTYVLPNATPPHGEQANAWQR